MFLSIASVSPNSRLVEHFKGERTLTSNDEPLVVWVYEADETSRRS